MAAHSTDNFSKYTPKNTKPLLEKVQPPPPLLGQKKLHPTPYEVKKPVNFKPSPNFQGGPPQAY